MTIHEDILRKVTILAQENSWGVQGTATKSLENLLEEVKLADCLLAFDTQGQLVRHVSVLNLEVRSGDQILVEDRQEFVNGDVRRRGLRHLAEKFDPEEESLEKVVSRALSEEVSYSGPFVLDEEVKESSSSEDSKSYPGLRTEYAFFAASVLIPASKKDEVRLVEVQEGKKTTYFVWENLRN